MNEILDMFYSQIIPEAATGRINCYLYYNIIFDTIIEGKPITKIPDEKSRLLIPTLIIKNKEKFNCLLIEYVKEAYNFYKESSLNSILIRDDQNATKDYIKSIMTLLWSNATSEDFTNPCEYLKKRIAFLKDNSFDKSFEPIQTSLGLLSINIKQDQLHNETPYYMEIRIDDNLLPIVRFGIYQNKAYIYAIQNITKTPRNKKLNRLLYKVNV